jgi:hypothetical protein
MEKALHIWRRKGTVGGYIVRMRAITGTFAISVVNLAGSCKKTLRLCAD